MVNVPNSLLKEMADNLDKYTLALKNELRARQKLADFHGNSKEDKAIIDYRYDTETYHYFKFQDCCISIVQGVKKYYELDKAGNIIERHCSSIHSNYSIRCYNYVPNCFRHKSTSFDIISHGDINYYNYDSYDSCVKAFYRLINQVMTEKLNIKGDVIQGVLL